jgi:hypothetical protein
MAMYIHEDDSQHRCETQSADESPFTQCCTCGGQHANAQIIPDDEDQHDARRKCQRNLGANNENPSGTPRHDQFRISKQGKAISHDGIEQYGSLPSAPNASSSGL